MNVGVCVCVWLLSVCECVCGYWCVGIGVCVCVCFRGFREGSLLFANSDLKNHDVSFSVQLQALAASSAPCELLLHRMTKSG